MMSLRSRVMRGTALLAAAGAVVLGGAVAAAADTGTQGAAVGSPGVLSGNVIQVPVDIPVNVCGDTIDVTGLLNPAFGNACANTRR
ncbi:chaplin [Streptomyces griseofuscus]|uniref:chaplin n=1 Tax=Streptomyces griseofuscus TaxID=146922 RepID=UPI00367FAE37